jgi:hypothetical protein
MIAPAMRTAVAQHPEETPSPIILPSKQEILRYFQELKGAAKTYRSALRRVGFYGWRLQQAEAWGALGFETEDDLREAIDVPSSTFYKWVRLCGILKDLSLEELESIPTTNLELLSQVTLELWPEHPWVEEARTLAPDKLAELITERNHSNGNGYEPMTVYREKVPYSSQKMIRSALEAFRDEHELASTGRALELMVADQYDRPSFIGGYVKIRRMMDELAVVLQQEDISNPRVNECVATIKAYVGEKCTQTIQAAREAKSKSNGREGQHVSAAESSGPAGTATAEDAGVASPSGNLPRVQ